MKYGQIVEWVSRPHGLPVWHRGIVLDVIPAGDYLEGHKACRNRLVHGDKVSVYDRVLVESYGPYGRQLYTPRLARIRAV